MFIQKISFVFLFALWSGLAFGQDIIPVKNPSFTLAQDTIPLRNPSFEDNARPGRAPSSWYDCGELKETPPDIHSTSSTFFNVIKYPTHGDSFMGMVTRDNGTWEAVAQRLKTPLLKNQKYQFQIDLCSSDTYNSISRTTGKPISHSTPSSLYIWGGDNYCHRKELLSATTPIDHLEWYTYTFVLVPESDLEYLVLEAFYKSEDLRVDNGSVILDNCSPIIPISETTFAALEANNPAVLVPNQKVREAPSMVNNNGFYSQPRRTNSTSSVTPQYSEPEKPEPDTPKEVSWWDQPTYQSVKDVIKLKQKIDKEAFPLIDEINIIADFYAFTATYEVVSYFDTHDYSECEKLTDAFISISAFDLAKTISQGMQLYFLPDGSKKGQNFTSDFDELDGLLLKRKKEIDHWYSIREYVEKNEKAFMAEVHNFSKNLSETTTESTNETSQDSTETAVVLRNRKNMAAIAKAEEIISTYVVEYNNKYPLLAKIDNVQEFFTFTDDYQLLFYFNNHSYFEVEDLMLSMLEIKTDQTAQIILKAMDLYYFDDTKKKMTKVEKATFKKLDNSIEIAKKEDDLWDKISKYLLENVDYFVKEVPRFGY